MRTLERVLFLGFLIRDDDAGSIFEKESHPQYSALRFQRNLLRALEVAGLSVYAVTTPPIAAFPRNRRWWVAGSAYELAGFRLRGRQMSGPNLPGLRLFTRLVQWLRHGLAAPADSSNAILVYSVHTPAVAAALLLKWRRGWPVFVFIPDLPTFMGGPSHVLKRLLKRVDAGIVRRLLAHADGAFPITEYIGRDWLVGGPEYWTMEGVSDAAAEALSSARANNSYVYRAAGRPTLLYTGRLEQTLRFVSAFHRSPIEATLVLTGGGEDAEELKSLAATDERIALRGFMPDDAFAQEVDRADFMLNLRDPAWPGAPYSFPSKLFEYLIYGKPVISTRMAGIPAEYFDLLRPIDLASQAAFETSLKNALAIDEDLEPIWRAAERLSTRLASASVGAALVQRMRQWTATR
jgi:glycosyltransferase involved in cell wall biosynthesis